MSQEIDFGEPEVKYPRLKKARNIIALLFGTNILASMIAKSGLFLPIVMIVIPLMFIGLYLIFTNPKNGFIICFVSAFIINGIGRYIGGFPFGLLIDIILLLTLFSSFFYAPSKDWSKVSNPIVILILIWFIVTVGQIFNPEARSFEAWFYAVRGIALYIVIVVPLVFVVFNKEKDYDIMIYCWLIGGIASAMYGMKQQYIGLDGAEKAWLAAGGAETHILFGRLRVFSFFSDAGQFGAFMGYTGLVAAILALGDFSYFKRIFFAGAAAICFLGMMLSGTRGALFVPLSGFFSYLFLSKNFKTLIAGGLAMGILFFILKFTFIGQGNYQVQRMRSALNPNDPSFQVRLENQRKFKFYLKNKPFGGGIGSAGYWGQRFSPGTFLAETPTDSHYVRIWAETGIVGVVIHVLVLISILGIGFFRIIKIPDSLLKQKLMAIFAGCFGIVVASYGNQVIGQMPTNIFFSVSLPFLFLGTEWAKTPLAKAN